MVAGLAAGLVAPVLGQGTSLAMLGRLDRGDWEIRVRDDVGQVQRVCLRDNWSLIQLRHRGENCRRVIVDDTMNEVTVQYTCPGRGYGRTQVRRETDRLVQIDSQGIANGVPFAFAAEARRVGDCSN